MTQSEAGLSCVGCLRGACAIYAPTHAAAPSQIEAQRRAVVNVRANRHVGEAGDGVYTIYSGWAARYMHSRDGRRQILEFLLPSDLIGVDALILDGLSPRGSIVALTDMTLCEFSPAAMRGLVFATPDQLRAARNRVGAALGALERRMFDLGRRKALGRVAQLFVELSARLHTADASANTYECPLRQDHIADALGLTPEHVSRTLAELKRVGAMEFAGNRLTILDADSLKAIAEDE